MMEIKDFFDRHAPRWDSYQTKDTHRAIAEIFAAAGLRPGCRVLDVGAGTGILYPYFLEAGAVSYSAVDISPEMVREFKSKYPEAIIIEADYEKPIFFPCLFDVVMIFNAFPHFRNEEAVFAYSYSYLAPGGRLFVCHSMNREALNEHHRNSSLDVAEDVLISDDRMTDLYRMSGFMSIRVENTDHFYSEGTK
jgi:demethylmenaquinone methyltransferase/2-methoxy-6-polyprenyl-1,4-benzoquinol methylase